MIGKRLDRVSSIATRLIRVLAFDNQSRQTDVSSPTLRRIGTLRSWNAPRYLRESRHGGVLKLFLRPLMKTLQKIAGVALTCGLAAVGYGIYHTTAPASSALGTVATSRQSQVLVDQAPLKTAQQLALQANLPEERLLAREALRLADHEVDLAFAAALHDAKEHPPALSADAKEIQARLQKAEKALGDDIVHVAQITAAEAKATGDKKDEVGDELELAKAQQELDQDEVDDARQDLIRAGGDPQDRIQSMVQEHETSTKATEAALANSAEAAEKPGLVFRVAEWWSLHQRLQMLWHAKSDADAKQAALAQTHNTLDSQVHAGDTVTAAPEPSVVAQVARAATPAAARPKRSHEESKSLVKAAMDRSSKQKLVSDFDKRIDDERELSADYSKWIDVVAGHQRKVMNSAFRGLAVILAIALVGMFFDTWVASLLRRTKLDRRQLETLNGVTRVSLQVISALLTLLVIFGLPGQLGTFLGLAGAGLTVALKDFITGFLGWFVLMGKNGIRLGDWVEINGVTGEVVELGMFHTVLLETGNWTDSGHPTGRRVTFTNGYAIEGHYFNFSTSGQWLWDELKIVLPLGQNPYPVVQAIQKQVTQVTTESAQQAEREWHAAQRSGDSSVLSAAPSVNARPVINGVEISVRYITRAHESPIFRAKLNQILINLLDPQAPAAVPNKPNESEQTVPELVGTFQSPR
jgi:small-conductance mechanosensitive channel